MKQLHLLIPSALLFVFLFFNPQNVFAQKDSIKRDTIKKEYNENQAQNDYYLKRREKYDYLTRAKIEELSMFKVGLYLMYSPNFFLGPSVGYEKKLSSDFSLTGGAGIGIPYFRSYGISLGGRYYYNMRERIWEGKSANNLSANYFSAQFIGANEFLGVEGLFGIQRRLGRLCFFDINIGGATSLRLNLNPAFNFEFGIGL